MSNLLRGDGNSQEQETTHASQFLLDNGMSANLTKKVRVLFGKIAAKLKRRRDNLPFDALSYQRKLRMLMGTLLMLQFMKFHKTWKLWKRPIRN